MGVKIITDSASNLYKELLEDYNIEMIAMNYSKNGEVRKCYNPYKSYDEQGKEFYDYLRNDEDIKTSLPSPSDFVDAFKKYLSVGNDIIFISISSKLSGTLNSAINAKMILQDEYPDRRIECIDSYAASFGEAFVVMKAAELAKENKNVDEILSVIEPMRMTIRCEFTVDDLKYLKKGGRISAAAAAIGSLLEIKPLLRASKEATIEACGKVVGRTRALRKLAETVKDTIIEPINQTIYIAHCDCKNDAELLAKWVRSMVGEVKDIVISMYDFCTGAHVGPGSIAIFYYGKERE